MSEHERIDDTLRRLGLEGYQAGTPDTQRPPKVDASKGLAGSPPDLAASRDEPAIDLLHASIERVGFEVGWLPRNTRILELFHPAGAPELLPAQDAAEIEDGVLRVDLTGVDEVVALEPGGEEGLYIRLSPGGEVTFWPIERPAKIALPPIAPPLSAWFDGLTGGEVPRDPWIVEEASALASRGRSGEVAAAGLLARLTEPDPDPSARRAQVAAMLAGAPPVAPQLVWARGLDPETTAALHRLTAAASLVLAADVADALAAPGGVGAQDLASLCAHRDDVECMRAVVLDPERRAALDAALEGVDADAARLIDALPEDVWFDAGARLERVATRYPEVWWVQRAMWR